MKLSEILIKPILTEKANGQQEKLRRYAFKVNRRANKLEIKTQAYSNTVSGKNAGRFLNQRQKRLLARRRNHRK